MLPHGPRSMPIDFGLDAPVAREDRARPIDRDGVREAELLDRGRDLAQLVPRVRPRVPLPRTKGGGRQHLDAEHSDAGASPAEGVSCGTDGSDGEDALGGEDASDGGEASLTNAAPFGNAAS